LCAKKNGVVVLLQKLPILMPETLALGWEVPKVLYFWVKTKEPSFKGIPLWDT